MVLLVPRQAVRGRSGEPLLVPIDFKKKNIRTGLGLHPRDPVGVQDWTRKSSRLEGWGVSSPLALAGDKLLLWAAETTGERISQGSVLRARGRGFPWAQGTPKCHKEALAALLILNGAFYFEGQE